MVDRFTRILCLGLLAFPLLAPAQDQVTFMTSWYVRPSTAATRRSRRAVRSTASTSPSRWAAPR
jgi:hypothetical protein